ncbi:MAG: hypothetical protein KDD76_05505 [Rickettsiales bacterium]|nr:hypothetical protein [Rickettsiales bacterium]
MNIHSQTEHQRTGPSPDKSVEKKGFHLALNGALAFGVITWAAFHNTYGVYLLAAAFAVSIIVIYTAAQRNRTLSQSLLSNQTHSTTEHHQTALLSGIIDGLPERVLAVSESGNVIYCNTPFATDYPNIQTGMPLESFLKEKRQVNEWMEHIRTALTKNETIRAWQQNKENIPLQRRFIPIKFHPESGLEGYGVLIIERDMHSLAEAQASGERSMQQLSQAVARFIDQRNPFLSNHSERIAALSDALALRMEVDETVMHTVELAARFAALGSTLIPPDKVAEATLDSHEFAQATQAAAEGLRSVEFGLPVADALLQSMEYLDGSGPKSIKAPDIMLAARILCVARQYIDLTTPHPARKSVTSDQAVKQMRKEAGTRYDPKVIDALATCVRSGDGPHEWDYIETMDF